MEDGFAASGRRDLQNPQFPFAVTAFASGVHRVDVSRVSLDVAVTVGFGFHGHVASRSVMHFAAQIPALMAKIRGFGGCECACGD